MMLGAGFLDGDVREVITIYEVTEDENGTWVSPEYSFRCDVLPSLSMNVCDRELVSWCPRSSSESVAAAGLWSRASLLKVLQCAKCRQHSWCLVSGRTPTPHTHRCLQVCWRAHRLPWPNHQLHR